MTALQFSPGHVTDDNHHGGAGFLSRGYRSCDTHSAAAPLFLTRPWTARYPPVGAPGFFLGGPNAGRHPLIKRPLVSTPAHAKAMPIPTPPGYFHAFHI